MLFKIKGLNVNKELSFLSSCPLMVQKVQVLGQLKAMGLILCLLTEQEIWHGGIRIIEKKFHFT